MTQKEYIRLSSEAHKQMKAKTITRAEYEAIREGLFAELHADEVRYFSLDGGPPFTLPEFRKDNPDMTTEELERIYRMPLGAWRRLGGGAGAEFIIMRVDRHWKGA